MWKIKKTRRSAFVSWFVHNLNYNINTIVLPYHSNHLRITYTTSQKDN